MADDLDPIADPPAADRTQVDLFWRALRKTVPGPWASDHWNQTTKGFVGATYVAVDMLGRAIGSATVNLMEHVGRSDRVGTEVRRALPTAGAQESDEQWVPAEPDHPARKIVEEPNPRQSIADVLYERTLQECLTGTSYTWAVPNGYGEPCEQYVIPTVLTLPLPASEDYPNGAYRIQPATAHGAYAVLPGRYAQTGAVLPAEQILVDRRPHPWVGYDGYSPLQAAETQLDVLRQIDIMRTSAAQNGAEPSLVIIAPPGTKPEEVDQLQAKLDRRFAGPWNHRKVMVISGGGTQPGQGMTVMPWSKGPGDLGGEETWEQIVGFVSALFGVPKVVTGLTDAGSYAEFFAALKQFYTRTLLPLAKRISWRLTQQLLWPYYGKRLRYQLDLPAIDDRESLRADLQLLAECQALRVNEVRTRLGFEPLPPDMGDKLVGEAQAEKDRLMLQAQIGKGAGGGGTPDADRPDNPDGKGSLPNRIGGAVKALAQTNGVHRAGDFDESKVKRDRGRFATKPGAKDGPDEPAAKEAPSARTETEAKETPAATEGDSKIPEPTEREVDSLAHLVPKAERGSWQKIKGAWQAVRLAVGTKVIEYGIPASYDVAPAVLDTADDYTTMKASVYADHDAWAQTTGLSWSFTSTLVKHAISAGFAAAHYVQGGEATKADRITPDHAEAVAAIVIAALEAVHDALGIDLAVDADLVRELVAKRLED